eukprot:jgi/Mesen1/681/ME000109S10899
MSDIWAIAISSIAFHQKVDWLYYAAFTAVAVGLLVYSSGGEPECAPEDSTDHPKSSASAFSPRAHYHAIGSSGSSNASSVP